MSHAAMHLFEKARQEVEESKRQDRDRHIQEARQALERALAREGYASNLYAVAMRVKDDILALSHDDLPSYDPVRVFLSEFDKKYKEFEGADDCAIKIADIEAHEKKQREFLQWFDAYVPYVLDEMPEFLLRAYRDCISQYRAGYWGRM